MNDNEVQPPVTHKLVRHIEELRDVVTTRDARLPRDDAHARLVDGLFTSTWSAIEVINENHEHALRRVRALGRVGQALGHDPSPADPGETAALVEMLVGYMAQLADVFGGGEPDGVPITRRGPVAVTRAVTLRGALVAIASAHDLPSRSMVEQLGVLSNETQQARRKVDKAAATAQAAMQALHSISQALGLDFTVASAVEGGIVAEEVTRLRQLVSDRTELRANERLMDALERTLTARRSADHLRTDVPKYRLADGRDPLQTPRRGDLWRTRLDQIVAVAAVDSHYVGLQYLGDPQSIEQAWMRYAPAPVLRHAELSLALTGAVFAGTDRLAPVQVGDRINPRLMPQGAIARIFTGVPGDDVCWALMRDGSATLVGVDGSLRSPVLVDRLQLAERVVTAVVAAVEIADAELAAAAAAPPGDEQQQLVRGLCGGRVPDL